MNAINQFNLLTIKLFAAISNGYHNLRDEDRGATATEYAILVGFIAIVIVVGVTLFGNHLSGLFTNQGNQIDNVPNQIQAP